MEKDFEQLLNLAERVTRSVFMKSGNLKSYYIADEIMDELKRLTEKHLGKPYTLQGGREVRE